MMGDPRHHSRTTSLGFAIVLAVVMAGWSASARADVITDWSAIAFQRAAAANMPPLRSSITFALVHLAMYDAVGSIKGGFRPYVAAPPPSPTPLPPRPRRSKRPITCCWPSSPDSRPAWTLRA